MNTIDPNLQDVLAKLKDITLPQDPSWWPPAPGRIIIIVLTIIIFVILIKKLSIYIVNKYNHRIKKQALDKLDTILNKINNGDLELINHINYTSTLLKQCAILKFKDKAIASLSGLNWLEFLSMHSKKANDSYFTSVNAQKINDLKYMNHMNAKDISAETIEETKKFIIYSKSWISNNL